MAFVIPVQYVLESHQIMDTAMPAPILGAPTEIELDDKDMLAALESGKHLHNSHPIAGMFKLAIKLSDG